MAAPGSASSATVAAIARSLFIVSFLPSLLIAPTAPRVAALLPVKAADLRSCLANSSSKLRQRRCCVFQIAGCPLQPIAARAWHALDAGALTGQLRLPRFAYPEPARSRRASYGGACNFE